MCTYYQHLRMENLENNSSVNCSNEHFDYASNSQIKNIYLQITNGYKYKHQSLQDVEDGFLGRKLISASFKDILKNGNSKGVYLVTGYRGMGKTSFVKQVLNNIKDDSKRENSAREPKIKEFFISLAQSQLKDVEYSEAYSKPFTQSC